MKVYILVDESSEADENVGVFKTFAEAEQHCHRMVALSFQARSERWSKAHAANESAPVVPPPMKWDRYDMLDFIQYSTEANYGSTANNLNEYYSIQEWEIDG
jgi:hypothetical protein